MLAIAEDVTRDLCRIFNLGLIAVALSAAGTRHRTQSMTVIEAI
jgi:hypothetical protein